MEEIQDKLGGTLILNCAGGTPSNYSSFSTPSSLSAASLLILPLPIGNPSVVSMPPYEKGKRAAALSVFVQGNLELLSSS